MLGPHRMMIAAVALMATTVSSKMDMPMKKQAFPTHSKDIVKEANEMADIMGLKAGSSIGEVGGGNGTLLINLAPKVLPGGKYYGTGHDMIEVDAMRTAADKAALSRASVAVAGETVSGLPAGCCDAIVLRMVYHMLDHPKEYLADFKRALKPNGKLLILEHNPDNGKTGREGAKLTVGMGGKTMDMAVVPQEAMAEEGEAAGFAVVTEPFGWEYFTGPHYVNSKDGKGYGIVFMKPEDVSPPPPPKRLCNCACGGSGQCGLGCSSCDCEGCAAPSPPPPPKPLCNCECGGSGQCGLGCSSCDCEGCQLFCNKGCGSPGQCGPSCSPCDCV